jgi:hypothetical protein
MPAQRGLVVRPIWAGATDMPGRFEPLYGPLAQLTHMYQLNLVRHEAQTVHKSQKLLKHK